MLLQLGRRSEAEADSARRWPSPRSRARTFRGTRPSASGRRILTTTSRRAPPPRPPGQARDHSRASRRGPRGRWSRRTPRDPVTAPVWPRTASTAAWPAAPWATRRRPTSGGRWHSRRPAVAVRQEGGSSPRGAHTALAGLAAAGTGISAAEGTKRGRPGRWPCCTGPIDLGYRSPDAYRTEDALDPLRDRPDFPALLLDLAFPADPNSR